MVAQVIKLRYDGDVRRLPALQLSWEDLRGKVCELYGLAAGSFRLKYVDCDGDTVLIDSEGELLEAIVQTRAGDMLRLTVEPNPTRIEKPTRNDNPTQAKVAADAEKLAREGKEKCTERVEETTTASEVEKDIRAQYERDLQEERERDRERSGSVGEGVWDTGFVEQYERDLERAMEESRREQERVQGKKNEEDKKEVERDVKEDYKREVEGDVKEGIKNVVERDVREEYKREVERDMERTPREKKEERRMYKEERRAGKEKERQERREHKEKRKEERRAEKHAEKENRKAGGVGGGMVGDSGAGPSGLYCGVDVDRLAERIAARLLPALQKETKETASAQEKQFKPPVNEGAEHLYVTCDVCNHGVFGVRYKCTVCADYDMCAPCEATSNHNPHHILLKILTPISLRFDLEVDSHPLRHVHGQRVCCPHPPQHPPSPPDTESVPSFPSPQQATTPPDHTFSFDSSPAPASQSLDPLPTPLLMEDSITLPSSPSTNPFDDMPPLTDSYVPHVGLSPPTMSAATSYIPTETSPINTSSPVPFDDDEFVVVDDPSAGGPSPPSGLYPSLTPLTPSLSHPPITTYPSFERAREVTCEMDTVEGDHDVMYPPIPPASATAPSAPPDLLAFQDAELSRLRQMLLELGFRDAARIDRYLSECGADLDTVVERLLADQ
eukprot:comp19170_c0_seq1/m.21866 comp19170_c0_seq1/g.21866  ORF comp19170_c0_seq1/g.21866 comp19170_c0_seq1/m.21866 type:complete len:671 (-) comp19170_c0_seq1:604-2616(-)